MRLCQIPGALIPAALIPFTLMAQQNLPVGIVRGHLLALQDRPGKRGITSSGEFTLQAADGSVYGCQYDTHTLFQRDRDVVRAEALRPGDPVEVVSDRRSGGCYTRVLSVTYAAPAKRVGTTRRSVGRLEDLPARGYLTVSGLVVRHSEGSMTVRTRSGIATLSLRADTRFSSDGVRLGSPESILNKHVFIRAGRNLDGTLVAYQVMWADSLLKP
jgi:hypothetical protein